MSTRDRRREPRIDTDLSGSLQGPRNTACRVVNLSRNGALAVSTEPLPENAEATVRLEAMSAEGKPIFFEGTAAVVRCAERSDGTFEVALFFLKLHPSDRECLDALIRSHEVTRA